MMRFYFKLSESDQDLFHVNKLHLLNYRWMCHVCIYVFNLYNEFKGYKKN